MEPLLDRPLHEHAKCLAKNVFQLMEDAAHPSKRPTLNTFRGGMALGSRVGSYEILSILGQGGFGITYRARDTTLNRDVAIKEYLPASWAIREGLEVVPRGEENAQDYLWGREAFLEEARTLARLEGVPAVVRVYDFLEDNGTAYMVMALLQGGTLKDRLRRDRCLPQPEIDRLLFPLLDGLERVHAEGFLHRDIKPANILLNADGQPTLIDFGASRSAIAGRTKALTAIFTPGYSPIEQFTSGPQGPWTDIYALGATLFECVTGQNLPGAVEQMAGVVVGSLSDQRLVGYSPPLLAAIDAAIKFKAAERPQSITAWRAVFTSVIPSSIQSADTEVRQTARDTVVAPGLARGLGLPSAESGSSSSISKKWRLKLAVAVISTAAIVGAVLLYTSNAQRNSPVPVVIQPVAQDDADKKKTERERLLAEAQTEETSLQMTPYDIELVQVALSSLGFNTETIDGTLGKNSRAMIEAWQSSTGAVSTGFLTRAQHESLLYLAAGAIAKYEADQRRGMGDKTRE